MLSKKDKSIETVASYYQDGKNSNLDPVNNPVTSSGILDRLLEYSTPQDYQADILSLFNDWVSTELSDDTQTRAKISMSIHRLNAFLMDVEVYSKRRAQMTPKKIGLFSILEETDRIKEAIKRMRLGLEADESEMTEFFEASGFILGRLEDIKENGDHLDLQEFTGFKSILQTSLNAWLCTEAANDFKIRNEVLYIVNELISILNAV